MESRERENRGGGNSGDRSAVLIYPPQADLVQQGNGADRPPSEFREDLDPPAADFGGLHGGGRRTTLGCNTGGRQLIAEPLSGKGGIRADESMLDNYSVLGK